MFQRKNVRLSITLPSALDGRPLLLTFRSSIPFICRENIMPDHTRTYQLPTGDRAQQRRDLIQCFLEEEPGSGKGPLASRYRYDVDAWDDYGIYLRRPTRLNKGFDFTVNIRGMYFRNSRRYSNPSHQDICNALEYCREAFPEEYEKVRQAISDIYCGREYDLSGINATFCDDEGQEHPIQIILLAIKWLFMEQDCAYWNYSGRQMFFKALQEGGLA